MARGIVDAQKSLPRKTAIIIRMIGTREKEGAEILRTAKIPFLDTMDAAARLAVQEAKRSKAK
jgi:succinyl-CoA synthetase beta subunit